MSSANDAILTLIADLQLRILKLQEKKEEPPSLPFQRTFMTWGGPVQVYARDRIAIEALEELLKKGGEPPVKKEPR